MNPNIRLLLLLIVLTSCKSSKKTKTFDEFKKVDSILNSSLDSQKSTRPYDSSKLILSSSSLQRAKDFVFSLKNKLAKADPSDLRTDIADSLIVLRKDGIELFDLMKSVYGHSEIEAHRKSFLEMHRGGPSIWLNKYFHKIPTIAARTILTKFSNDIELLR